MSNIKAEAARALVLAQITSHTNEQNIHTWWETFGETVCLTQRERALSLDFSPSAPMQTVPISKLVRPYSKDLESEGENVVCEFLEPKCLFSKKWGKLVLLRSRHDFNVWVGIVKNDNDCPDSQSWKTLACVEFGMEIARFSQSVDMPNVNMVAWGNASKMAIEMANLVSGICDNVNLWLIGPTCTHNTIVNKGVCARSLMSGDDRLCSPVPGCTEIWLEGVREPLFPLCCSARKNEEHEHSLRKYANKMALELRSFEKLYPA
jgi:hypothetical protein